MAKQKICPYLKFDSARPTLLKCQYLLNGFSKESKIGCTFKP